MTFASSREKLQSIAHKLMGELFMAWRESWVSGERVATLCLPREFRSSNVPIEAESELLHLADEIGLNLFDPQTGKGVS